MVRARIVTNHPPNRKGRSRGVGGGSWLSTISAAASTRPSTRTYPANDSTLPGQPPEAAAQHSTTATPSTLTSSSTTDHPACTHHAAPTPSPTAGTRAQTGHPPTTTTSKPSQAEAAAHAEASKETASKHPAAPTPHGTFPNKRSAAATTAATPVGSPATRYYKGMVRPSTTPATASSP